MIWVRNLVAVISLLAVTFTIGCGSDKPPSKATIKELALLSEAGNKEAASELSRLDVDSWTRWQTAQMWTRLPPANLRRMRLPPNWQDSPTVGTPRPRPR